MTLRERLAVLFTLTVSDARERFTARHCWQRLKEIPNDAGMWGKTIACVLSASLAINISGGHAPFGDMPGLASLAMTLGLKPAVIILLLTAVLPMVGIITDFVWLRSCAVTMGLFTWIYLFIQAVFYAPDGLPTVLTCIVCIAAFVNAEFHLARRVRAKHNG